jgi:hypothetical protein
MTKQSGKKTVYNSGLLRRCAPRKDVLVFCFIAMKPLQGKNVDKMLIFS